MENWLQQIIFKRLPVYQTVLAKIPIHGKGLEIGSGSSAFGITASRRLAVESIVCSDIEPERLSEAKDFFLPRLQGESAKITFLVADFHKLPFKNHVFDFILADAALHHSTSPNILLSELKRVLKAQGTIIAVREPIAPKLPGLKQWRKMTFGWRQRYKGDIENIYTQEEWRELFHDACLDLTLLPLTIPTTVKEKILHFLKKFNSIFFNRYALIVKP